MRKLTLAVLLVAFTACGGQESTSSAPGEAADTAPAGGAPLA